MNRKSNRNCNRKSSRALRPSLAWVLVLGAVAGCSGAEAGFGGGGFGGGEGGFGGTGGTGGTGGVGGGVAVPLVATEIAVGQAHSCALVEGGAVLCWGDDSHGQLGDGVSSKDRVSLVPAPVPGISGATAIRAGGDTTCAIVGGGVMCWGAGAYGQLGNGIAMDGYYSSVPVHVIDLSSVVDLSVTSTNACAVLSGGGVRCWGRNTPVGALGFPSSECGPYTEESDDGTPKVVSYPCESTPKSVAMAKLAADVASGGAHNCIRSQAGSVRCWGSDQFGQLGDGAFGPNAFQSEPVSALGVADVISLSLGASHSCARVSESGRVFCWGDNADGQLGIGTNAIDSYKVTPVQVQGLDATLDLSSAARTICAVSATGSVLCWGDTATVLPVSPAKGSALVPTAVPALTSAVSVRTGGAHACALLDDQSVVCWGSNDRGQLGTGGQGLADFSMAPVLDAQAEPL